EYNRFYLTVGETFLAEDLAESRPERREAVAETTRLAERSRAKEFAIDAGGEVGMAALSLADLYAERDALVDGLRGGPKDPSRELEQVRAERGQAHLRLEELAGAPPAVGAPRRARVEHEALVGEWGDRLQHLETMERELLGRRDEHSRYEEQHGPQRRRLDGV